jgi:hypothetical protein
MEIAERLAQLSMQQKNTPPRIRLVELTGGTGNHREALGQSLVYRIGCSPMEFEFMSRRLHERGVLTLYNHNPTTLLSYQRTSIGDGLKEFNKAVQTCPKTIPFDVLYQLEALVRNGFLSPWTVHRLLEMMVRRSKETPRIPTKSTSKVR